MIKVIQNVRKLVSLIWSSLFQCIALFSSFPPSPSLSFHISLSPSVSQQQGVFLFEKPHFSTVAAKCQDVAQGWLKVGDSVLGDGLEKIPLMNRWPGLYTCRAAQHQSS